MSDARPVHDAPDAADETLLQREYLFRGKLINLRLDHIRTAAGHETAREIVEHPGAIAVVPQLPDGRIILVRQYRRPTETTLLEVPAGTREPDEDAEACARRELEEEIGYRAGRVEHLGGFYTSPGFCTEYMDVYLATELSPVEGETPAEFEEALEIVQPAEVPRLFAAGEPFDAKTLAAVLLVAARSTSRQ